MAWDSPEKSIRDHLVQFENGGREGIRTLDLSVANAALSQLSYAPMDNYQYNMGVLPGQFRKNCKNCIGGPVS